MQENNEVISAKTNQVIEINANEIPKKTKTEIVEAMKRLYVELQIITESITEDLTNLKDEAKERNMPSALMAKVAKLQAESKVEDVLCKNEEFASLVSEIYDN